MGPIGTMKYPDITAGRNGRLAEYSDSELARLIKHGIKRSGTTVRFMPSTDFSWWPNDDVVALISYLRTVPPVDGVPGVVEVGVLAKVLDRLDLMPLDVARRIDHSKKEEAIAPAPTAAYGAYVARLCKGCHGEGLSGGKIPGAPPDMAIPLNLTPHETGLKGWAFEDFEKTLKTGVRKNGKTVDKMMPVEMTKNFDDNELRGLFAYLQSVPPAAFGGR